MFIFKDINKKTGKKGNKTIKTIIKCHLIFDDELRYLRDEQDVDQTSVSLNLSIFIYHRFAQETSWLLC